VHGQVFSVGPIASIGTLRDPKAIGCHDGFRFPRISDPDPGGCGFGKRGEVIELDVSVESRCWDEFSKLLPPVP